MSAAAAWSFTSKATLWSLLSRDDWSGVSAWAAPQVFPCDFKADSIRMTDARGIEFTTRQLVYTERANIKQGDMLLIGTSAAVDPVAAGALEVRKVTRYADTFEGVREDFEVAT